MIRRIKVFISSPNDLLQERDICKKIINELNATLPKKCAAWLDPFFWEEQPQIIGMGSAQGRIPSPAEFDLFIGMFGKRYGTPTGAIDPETGEKYRSGTEQEFKEAYRSWKATNGQKPEIKFMRKAVDVSFAPGTEEYDQYERVEEFFAEFKEGGKHPGLPLTFAEEGIFKTSIREMLVDYCERTQTNVYLGHHYADAGVTGLFLPGDNSIRNESKKDAIRDTTRMRLIAHSGNSYLNDSAERFYADVEGCLKRGGKVEVILANPYSEMGYYITAGNVRRQNNNKSLVEFLRAKSSERLIGEIRRSNWVEFKLNAAIDGFRDLYDTYGQRIRLKICAYEMNSTILLTDKIAYVEPYLHCVGAERGMNAFEIRVERKEEKDTVFDALSEYFDFLWEISETFEQYEESKHSHEQALREKMKRLDALLRPEKTLV